MNLRRLEAFVVVLTVLLMLSFAWAAVHPTVASARWLRGDDGARRVVMYEPSSRSATMFNLEAWAGYGLHDAAKIRMFRGSKRTTTYRVWYLNSDSTQYAKTVGYSKFKSYMHAHPAASGNVRYVWKRTSTGRRYRYAKTIEAKYFAPDIDNAYARPVSELTYPLLGTRRLLNGVYLIGSPSEQVTVKSGYWESGDPAALDYDEDYYNVSVQDTLRRGDVDADGQAEAAVLMLEGSMGSGQFVRLAVVDVVNGATTHTATFDLGDRVIIDDVRIADGVITVKGLAHYDDDPMSSPSRPMTSSFAVRAGVLQVVAGDAATSWQ